MLEGYSVLLFALRLFKVVKIGEHKFVKSKIHAAVIFFLLIVCIALGLIAINPEWREHTQEYFASDRTVLATVRGRFVANMEPLKAVKAVDSSGVFVEIFRESENESLILFAKVMTGQPYDGKFNFRGRVTSLVAADIDQDGVDELLVPTFDIHRQPRLSVFKYQPDMKEFQIVEPPSSLE